MSEQNDQGSDDGIDYTADDASADTATDEGTGDAEADFESLLAAEKGDGYREDDAADDVETDEESVEAKSDGEQEEAATEESKDPEPKVEEQRAKTTASEERIVRRLQRSEARVVELERQLREPRQAPQRPEFEPSGDVIGDVIQLAARYVGADVQDTDPRVQAQLQQIGLGLVAHLAGDNNDPELVRIRQDRDAKRRHAEVQRQIDDLKRMNAAKDSQLQEQEARSFVSVGLKEINAADEYPFLHAAEDDVSAAVYVGLNALHSQGYQIKSRQDAVDAMAYVCKTLEDEHRRTAERLDAAKNGKKSATSPNQQLTETRGAQKDGPTGRNRGEDRGRPTRTVTASGAGNRQAPAPKTAETNEDLFESLLKEDRDERRRNASQRTRR